MEGVPLAQRSNASLTFFLDPWVSWNTTWLRAPEDASPPSSWTQPSFSDASWEEFPAGRWVTEGGPLFLRKHFAVAFAKWSAVVVSLQLRGGAQVFLNGRLVQTVNLTPGCSASACVQLPRAQLAVATHQFSVPLAPLAASSDYVLAVRLLPPAAQPQELFFDAAVFPLVVDTQLSSERTPITRSAPILPVAAAARCAVEHVRPAQPPLALHALRLLRLRAALRRRARLRARHHLLLPPPLLLRRQLHPKPRPHRRLGPPERRRAARARPAEPRPPLERAAPAARDPAARGARAPAAAPRAAYASIASSHQRTTSREIVRTTSER